MVTGVAARLALLFPGQGSQAVGMGKAICDAFPPARAIFERAEGAAGLPLARLCFEGPEEAQIGRASCRERV